MKNVFRSLIAGVRAYRKFSKTNRTYRVVNYSLVVVCSVYCALLLFPPLLFGHEMSHKNFHVYSREPLNDNLRTVLDSAESRLLRSPIYKADRPQTIQLVDSFGLYKFMTVKGDSMGSTIPVIGLSRINKSDIDRDLVFRNSEPPNQRILSGVIAHEAMHNQIREHLGLLNYYRLPTWKDEGYCEYIAGETSISFEEGLRRWREKPEDPTRYAYFRYHQMVKYLLDDRGVSVEDLFTQAFDEKEVSDAVFAKISR